MSDTKVAHIKETHIRDSEPSSQDEFSLKEELKKLEDNPRRDLNIIALLLERKKPDIKTAGQLRVFIKRHLRSAGQLKEFTDKQIWDAIDYAEKEYRQIPWSGETIIKILTSGICQK